jgi:hypothetical protein
MMSFATSPPIAEINAVWARSVEERLRQGDGGHVTASHPQYVPKYRTLQSSGSTVA